jgi:hypothetical protein
VWLKGKREMERRGTSCSHTFKFFGEAELEIEIIKKEIPRYERRDRF